MKKALHPHRIACRGPGGGRRAAALRRPLAFLTLTQLQDEPPSPSGRRRGLLRGLRAGRRGNPRPGGTRGGWLRQAKGRGGVEARSGKDRGAAGLVSSRVVVVAATTTTTGGGG